MLFDTLQIPDPLLVAQQEGRLVVFAGAGVSVGEPSRLPTFLGLAEQISPRPLTERDKSHLDTFIGELEDEGIDVHAEAGRIFCQPSQPTELHRDLMRLFPSREQVRLVTSNFDPHFRNVAREMDPEIPVFTAPALPRGGNFSGVVELHGSAFGTPSDMVLTDRDFGVAYLTEGWARAFVEQMFRKYVVLFVGYSLTDPPMHYFARGLPTEKDLRRYVITNQPPARWKALGVGVIPYQEPEGQHTHAPLGRGVAAWVQITRGSNFWIEERIVNILEMPDPAALPVADAELLLWSLGQDFTANYFVRNARGMRWVEWLAGQGLLKPYFDSKTTFEHARQRQVAAWLAERLIEGPRDRAFGVMHANGGRLSSELCRWLRIAMDLDGTPVEWTLLLASQVASNDADMFFDLAMRATALANNDSPAFWPLWSDLVSPVIELDGTGLESSVDAHAVVGVKCTAAELWFCWSQGLRPNLPRIGRRMLALLFEKWALACELARGIGGSDGLESLHRTATEGRRRIQRTDSDFRRGHRPAVLVDMLVDLVTYYTTRSGELKSEQISAWLDSDESVVRRIGLHALFNSIDVSAADKLAHLRSRLESYPQGSREHAEAGVLLADLNPSEVSSGSLRDDSVVPFPFSDSLPPVRELLALSREQLTRRLTFVRWVQEPVLQALQDLDRATDATPDLISHPLWIRLLQSCVWRELDAARRDAVLGIIRRRGLISRHPHEVVRALFSADPLATESVVGATSSQIDDLFAMSRELWYVIGPEDVAETEPNYARVEWVTAALKHGVFYLVQFWFRYLSIQATDPGDLNLPTALAEIFEDVVARNTSTGRRARAALVQDAGYLMVRDPGWSVEYIIPLFDFASQGDGAWVVWRAFLDHGRLNRALVLAIIPAYRAARVKILEADDRQIQEYLRNVAGMMLYVQTPEAQGWQEELLPSLDEEGRLRWARLVGRELPTLTDAQQTDLWDAWMAAYWGNRRIGRLGTHTLPLTARECAIMAGWLPSLAQVFSEAFVLLRSMSHFDFDSERFDWRELRQSSVPSRHPAEFLAFLEFLLARMPQTRVHHDSIREAVNRLPRLAVFRDPMLRVAEVFQRHAWIHAKAFRAWVETEFPVSC